MEPRLTVVIVPFQFRQGTFCVGTLEFRDGTHVLPSQQPATREPLDAAAERLMREVTGHPPAYMEQLYTVSIEQRDPWRIIVSYLELVAPDTDRPGEELVWVDPEDVELRRETDRMLHEYALVRLRAKLGYTNIAFHLLPPTFTFTQLQQVYEQVLGQTLDKRNFRRRMSASGILTRTGVRQREGSHRPAELYRFTSEADQSTYLTPPWASSDANPS
ncbi:MAG: NUDIX hydrolase [Chloroflexota bacterium]|nr:NUDIX hydrolase [Chloroflexota bacterium]